MPKTKTKATTKKKAATKTLNIVFVWDMSGSMAMLYSSALEGATGYIRDLAADKNAKNMRISITAFDTVFEKWFVDCPVGEVPISELTAKYQPRGWTALNDAVADAIFTMDEKVKDSDEKVLIVVLTDGLENSSKEYPAPHGTKALAELVKLRELTGRWTFVYLGAGKPSEVAHVAATYNIPRGNTMSYAATDEGMGKSYAAITHATVAVAAAPAGSTISAFKDAGFQSVEEQEEEGNS